MSRLVSAWKDKIAGFLGHQYYYKKYEYTNMWYIMIHHTKSNLGLQEKYWEYLMRVLYHQHKQKQGNWAWKLVLKNF